MFGLIGRVATAVVGVGIGVVRAVKKLMSGKGEGEKIEVKEVEKVTPEDSKLIPIKDKKPISITLPQPKAEKRPEPKIPTKAKKFKGLEDEDSMEYIDGPSFDSIEE